MSVDLFAILATRLRSDVANVRDRAARMEGMMATLLAILLRRADRDAA